MRGRNARGSNHARVESWTGVLRLGTATTLRRRVAPTRRGSRESLQKSRPTPCEPAVTGLEMGIRQRFAGGQQGATIGPKLFREWRIRGAERRVGPRSGHAASAGSRQPDLRVGGVELRARRTVVGFGRAPGRAPEPHTFRGPSSCPTDSLTAALAALQGRWADPEAAMVPLRASYWRPLRWPSPSCLRGKPGLSTKPSHCSRCTAAADARLPRLRTLTSTARRVAHAWWR